ncbi:hypothetical protein EXIGLDRAFT_728317 [Exidia glandulosa HHB12029]|uniref:Uncharacterized protein n=1 Tax=Exidia glandulosa HHB12029 TaxID=1314781 RepID=A0A165LT89_EXIGL|nr:hypothetical protein EXIGLDRAFT_728317 [Exidia glandulosa HHB12029]
MATNTDARRSVEIADSTSSIADADAASGTRDLMLVPVPYHRPGFFARLLGSHPACGTDLHRLSNKSGPARSLPDVRHLCAVDRDLAASTLALYPNLETLAVRTLHLDGSLPESLTALFIVDGFTGSSSKLADAVRHITHLHFDNPQWLYANFVIAQRWWHFTFLYVRHLSVGTNVTAGASVSLDAPEKHILRGSKLAQTYHDVNVLERDIFQKILDLRRQWDLGSARLVVHATRDGEMSERPWTKPTLFPFQYTVEPRNPKAPLAEQLWERFAPANRVWDGEFTTPLQVRVVEKADKDGEGEK